MERLVRFPVKTILTVLGLIVGAAAYGYVRFRHRFAARNKNQRDRS